jgi:predicted tellurium resistance membrane protein TerC
VVELLWSPEAWVSLLILTIMEVVLGIDNIVFIAILCGRLPREQQLRARRLGLAMALVSRILLLFGISWVMGLTKPAFHFVQDWSGKDLVLFFGGAFLLYKATKEIYENVEHPEEGAGSDASASPQARTTLIAIVAQVMLLDVVFSLDSVITAVGMAEHVPVMVAAVLIAVGVMMVFAGPIGDFVQDNPSIRVLALAFLMLIGVMLVMDATGQHVSKGYIYSAMGFSLFVQMLNLRRDRRSGVESPQ